jgi:hypothetical protein
MLVFDSEKFFPTKPQAGEPPLVGPSAISCSKYPHTVGTGGGGGLFNKQSRKIKHFFKPYSWVVVVIGE